MDRRNADGRGRTALLISLTGAASLLALAPAASVADTPASGAAAKPASAGAQSKTFGLVLTSWDNGIYETPDAKEECSLGFQPGEVAQLKATPGAVDRLKKYGGAFEIRGPNGETITPPPALQAFPAFSLAWAGTPLLHESCVPALPSSLTSVSSLTVRIPPTPLQTTARQSPAVWPGTGAPSAGSARPQT